MDIRRSIRNFFGFTQSQTNGFIILVPFILLVVFSEPLWRIYRSQKPHDFSKENVTLDSLLTAWNKQETVPQILEDNSTPNLFRFDPNLAAENELLSLGFTKSMTNRLVNYRTKGGSFKIKRDLLKLYGMDSAFYTRLEPYIALPESINTQNQITISKRETIPVKPLMFDLNLADTTQLKSVRGIGPKLSKRIIAFRESLGGFISLKQLNEVFGLDSLVVAQLRTQCFIHDTFQPRLLNLNTASESELADHPYISYQLARNITAYRFQHRKFSDVDDLLNLNRITEKEYLMIKPYVTIE